MWAARRARREEAAHRLGTEEHHSLRTTNIAYIQCSRNPSCTHSIEDHPAHLPSPPHPLLHPCWFVRQVGDLDGTVTSADLRAAFARFGPLIDEETFVKANNGKYGFVRFQTRSDAERAKQQMNRKTLGSRAVRIGWGDNNLQKHCVHVQFMPHSSTAANTATAAAQPPLHQLINESVVHKEFRRFGSIVSVSLPRTAEMRLKGFAFVHFGESEAGEQSAAAAVSTMADGQVNGVPVRVSYGKRQVAPRYRGRSVSGSSSGSAAGGNAMNGRSRSGDEGLRDDRSVYTPLPFHSPVMPPSSPPFNSFGYASPPIHGRVPSSPSPLASPLTVPMYSPAYYSQPLYLLNPNSTPPAFYPTHAASEPIPLQLGDDGSMGWYAAGGGAGGSLSMREQLVYQMAAMQQHQQQQQQQQHMYLARQQQQQQQQQQQRPAQGQMQQTGMDGDQQPMTSSGVG